MPMSPAGGTPSISVTWVRWRLLSAAFPQPHSLFPVFVGEHLSEQKKEGGETESGHEDIYVLSA